MLLVLFRAARQAANPVAVDELLEQSFVLLRAVLPFVDPFLLELSLEQAFLQLGQSTIITFIIQLHCVVDASKTAEYKTVMLDTRQPMTRSTTMRRRNSV